MRLLKPNKFKILNANRRLRAKKYLAGKKKNMFGIMKNKQDVIDTRKHLARGKQNVKEGLGRDALIRVTKKIRATRATVKKKGAATKARNNVKKKMQMGQGIYV